MSAALQARIKQFEALSLRERRLGVIAAAVLGGALLYVLAVAPAERASAKLTKEISAVDSSLATQDSQLSLLRQSAAVHPDQARLDELAQLEQQSVQLQSELHSLGSQLVAPQQMLAMLRELLDQQRGWSVVSLRTRASERLSMPFEDNSRPGEPAPVRAETAAPALYRHAVDIEIETDYNAAIDYLQRIEQLPVRIETGSLDLEVLQWPRLRVRLRLFSLSLQEGWLGV